MANCIDCNQSAQQDSDYCAACEQKKFRRIGGWLWVPFVWLLIMLVENTFGVANQFMLMAYLAHPSALEVLMMKFELVGYVLLWLLVAYTLVLFKSKKHYLPGTYILVITGSLLFTILNIGLGYAIFDHWIGRETVISVALQAVNVAIWSPYFLQSTRVKCTFVRP